MCWGTPLPRHICWSYYYDPRCHRGPHSNLAMLCIPSVMILAIIPESIPWCHLVSRHSTSGFWARDSPYLLHVDGVASAFRILVTFAIVLEVCGISFFQIPWTAYGRSSFEPKDHNQSALDEFSIPCCDSASSTTLHGLSGRNMLNSFDILIYASTTQKVICSFELSLVSYFLALVCQLIVEGISLHSFIKV